MKHGEANNKDGTRSRLYVIWCHMKERCENPNSKRYSLYGGRGIKVCDSWKGDYRSFRDWSLSNGYTTSLTIERIDTNGNYSPENCRWATQKEQCNNRRTNHLLTYEGRTQTLTQWAEEKGFRADTIKHRLKRGWSIKDALELPLGTRC